MILRCEAVLFDLDGVLVDSTACVEETWRRWAADHGLDPAAVIAEAHGRRSIDTIRRVAPQLAAEQEVAALAARESTTTEGVYEVPGAHSLLERLPAERWAIVTSGIRSVASLRIAHTRLPFPPSWSAPTRSVAANRIQRATSPPHIDSASPRQIVSSSKMRLLDWKLHAPPECGRSGLRALTRSKHSTRRRSGSPRWI